MPGSQLLIEGLSTRGSLRSREPASVNAASPEVFYGQQGDADILGLPTREADAERFAKLSPRR